MALTSAPWRVAVWLEVLLVKPLEVKLERQSHKEEIQQLWLLKATLKEQSIQALPKMLEQLLPRMGLPLLLRKLQMHPQSQQNLSPRHLKRSLVP